MLALDTDLSFKLLVNACPSVVIFEWWIVDLALMMTVEKVLQPKCVILCSRSIYAILRCPSVHVKFNQRSTYHTHIPQRKSQKQKQHTHLIKLPSSQAPKLPSPQAPKPPRCPPFSNPSRILHLTPHPTPHLTHSLLPFQLQLPLPPHRAPPPLHSITILPSANPLGSTA